MNRFIDTHVHLGDFEYPKKTMLELIQRKQYTISMTNLPEQYVDLKKKLDTNKNNYIRYALGYHPQEAGRHKFNSFLFTKYFATTNYIGEVGLDFSKEYVKFSEEQIKVFSYICKMSQGNKKILSIHCVKAAEEVLNILKKNSIETAIIHWYSGNIDIAKKMIEEGFYFSINEKMLLSNKGKELCKILPKNKILIESDAPYIIQDTRKYFNQIETTYHKINSNGISKEQIFMNFKELLKKFQKEDSE